MLLLTEAEDKIFLFNWELGTHLRENIDDQLNIFLVEYFCKNVLERQTTNKYISIALADICVSSLISPPPHPPPPSSLALVFP